MDRRTRRSVVLLHAAALLATLVAGAAGCSPGVRWRYDAFDPVFSDSRKSGKLTLVYFRSWYSVQCTRAEESVFNAPAMQQATAGMNCVPLDFDWDRPLATNWRVTSVPAFVILDPEGRVIESQSGELTLQTVLDTIARAKSSYGATSQPASRP